MNSQKVRHLIPCGTLLKLNLNLNPVAALNLSPGSHTFKISAHHLKGEPLITFSCQEGEVLYFVIDISAERYSKWFGAIGTEWKISQYKDIPSIFTNRDMILYRGGRWIADPDPDY